MNFREFGVRRQAGWLGMMIAVIVLAGCATEPARVDTGQLIEIKGDMDEVWRVCQEELKSRGFELDRVDRRQGEIETFPMTSGQWFEFWRHDVTGDYAREESDLQSVQRKVKMKVSPLKDQKYQLLCEVSVERREADPQEVRTMGGTHTRDLFPVFEGRIPGVASGKTKESPGPQWTPLGDDPDLERAILQRIIAKLPGK
jgi:hypothetical protein